MAILEKWAQYAGISTTDEDALMQKFHTSTKTNHEDVRNVLRRTVLRWLDEGLFVDEYEPLCMSSHKNTCNDATTKHPHKEVFSAWMRAKNDATEAIQKLITAGHLTLEDRPHSIWGMSEIVRTLTGESIYYCPSDLSFVNEYKAQIDTLRPTGAFLVFLHRQSFLREYGALIAFRDMFTRLSRIYEVDAGRRINTYIEDLENSVRLLNSQVRLTIENHIEALWKEYRYMVDIADTVEILLSEIEPGTGETETHYQTEFARLFEAEW
jgi:hypothetical protein